ncbi:MAG TPA: NAD(P)-binding domain-containing protein [Candidatus Sulfomarinibacteraceae bacterium]|nr:NAD(P)-binding domain-containing protein [Candidatus Sulfomarinibacteraceae bacterium]
MSDNVPQAAQEIGVAVIGGGPIGIERAIALLRAGLDYILFEANEIGHTISMWPPNTHFYSTPEHVALAGVPVHNLNQQSITGEQYLAYLRTLVEYFDLNLHNYEAVTDISRQDDGFLLSTQTQRGNFTYRCRHVILSTGGMAGPRLLGIPGEDLPHVRHYFPGPHPYFRRRLLVVGGKNSALEAALRCWRGGAQVTISYRRPQFDYEVVKPHLADDISTRLEKGEIDFLPCTLPVEIAPTHVVLAHTGEQLQPTTQTFHHETDFVLLATGFESDMGLFRKAGVELRGPEQAPFYNPKTMETNVPGLYVAGTAAGGTQLKFEYFISTSHDHVARIIKALTGRLPDRLGTVDARNNAVSWEEVKAN